MLKALKIMRLDRLLSIIIILSQRGLVTGKELAEHFEVSLRTIYRDIDKIGEAGVPIAATGGSGGGYYIMEGYNINNLFLKKNDIEPLIAVMDNLKVLFGNNQQFNDIVLKFEALNDRAGREYDRLTIDMSHFSMEQELKEYLFLINKAIEEDRLLQIKYINRKMEYTKRVIEPIQIEFSDGHWYIIAFCRTRKDYRKFKLVRVRNMKLGESFTRNYISKEEIKKVFIESYKRNSIAVTLRFCSEIGEQLFEYFSKDKIKILDDGRYIVEDSFPKDEGLIKFILGFGDSCEVLAPKVFREEISGYVKNIMDRYNG